MFDIGFFEITLIAVVALLVLGPEKMPHAVRMCAAYWGRLKRSIIATKIELEEQLALEDIRRQLREEQQKVQALMDQQDQEEGQLHKSQSLEDKKDIISHKDQS